MSTEANRLCTRSLLLQPEDYFFFDESRIVRKVAMGKVVISLWIASRLLQRSRSCDQFTRREIDLLRLLADGYQVEEIADRLGVVRGTVYNTLSGVYDKLGVHGAVPAVLEAVRRGIITL